MAIFVDPTIATVFFLMLSAISFFVAADCFLKKEQERCFIKFIGAGFFSILNFCLFIMNVLQVDLKEVKNIIVQIWNGIFSMIGIDGAALIIVTFLLVFFLVFLALLNSVYPLHSIPYPEFMTIKVLISYICLLFSILLIVLFVKVGLSIIFS